MPRAAASGSGWSRGRSGIATECWQSHFLDSGSARDPESARIDRLGPFGTLAVARPCAPNRGNGPASNRFLGDQCRRSRGGFGSRAGVTVSASRMRPSRAFCISLAAVFRNRPTHQHIRNETEYPLIVAARPGIATLCLAASRVPAAVNLPFMGVGFASSSPRAIILVAPLATRLPPPRVPRPRGPRPPPRRPERRTEPPESGRRGGRWRRRHSVG